MSIQQECKAFMRANDNSPVIDGHVISHEHGGAQYTLENDEIFRLSRDVCRALPRDYPKWKLS